MGATKKNPYTETQEKLSLIGKAFGHEARVKILEMLYENENRKIRNVDLTEVLNMSRPAVKSHIDKLVKAKIIKVKYDVHYYDLKLNKKGVKFLEANLSCVTN